MPHYDYVCNSCGFEKEVFHKMTESPEIFCDRCNTKLNKKIGAGAGIVFKGSGFYVTDYKSKPAECSKSESNECACCKND